MTLSVKLAVSASLGVLVGFGGGWITGDFARHPVTVTVTTYPHDEPRIPGGLSIPGINEP